MFRHIVIVLVIINLALCTNEVRQSILKNFENKPTKDYFKVFHYIYNKVYDLNSEEGIKRYRIFKDNLKIINQHNLSQSSYKLGVNEFADMTKDEFIQKYLIRPELKRKQIDQMLTNFRHEGYFDKYADQDEESTFYSNENKFEGKSTWSPINWTSSFGEARSQESCGSCWAFTVSGVVESYRNRREGRILGYLSPQHLVDCNESNNGCNGGNSLFAFNYIRDNGIADESDYIYKAVKGECKIPNGTKLTKINGISFCSNYYSDPSKKCNDEIIYNHIRLGASAVGIDGSALQLYQSGVFTGTCSEDNHAVILAGYGIENGKEYFLIRNSWGSGWGEQGYVKVARNSSNKESCFVANESISIS